MKIDIEEMVNDLETTQSYLDMAIENCPNKSIKEELEEIYQEVDKELKFFREKEEENWKSEIEYLNRDYERSV